MSLASTVTDLERRPIEDVEDVIDDEIKKYFELPRHSSYEMIPHLLRLKKKMKRFERHRTYRIYLRQLQRARIPDAAGAMRHVIDLDKSDNIVPHGEVSKRIYEEIRGARDFDLYGRPIERKRLTEEEERSMHDIASRLGLSYETKAPPIEEYVKVPDIFENVTNDLKKPSIGTNIDKIGFEPQYLPPVGFSRNPTQPLRSYGNDMFFAYDGEWSEGKMSGFGLYQYQDGGNYKGYYKTNRPHGPGKATYPNNCSYEGSWDKGRYGGGEGKQMLREWSIYEGFMNSGRREGTGKLTYLCGMIYEGEFLDGKPHGRGKMTSSLTKWGYEGTFSAGSIEGSGTLITPNNERVVQYWPASTGEGVLLPTVVRYTCCCCCLPV